METKVLIDGYPVNSDEVDKFYNGDDGSRVTDEEWDESRDRNCASLEELSKLRFDYVWLVQELGDDG